MRPKLWKSAMHLVPLALAGALMAAPPARAGNAQGLLYGRVTSRAGAVYEGRLRWGDEEASWVDLFNSAKIENPWREAAGRPRTARRIEVFGVPLPFASNPEDEDRQFIARFGDIARITVGERGKATVVMKSGVTYPIGGGSNDVGAEVQVWDAKAGEVKLRWDRIASIEFLPTPAALQGPARLYGTVRSREGEFTGTLQWDARQGLVTDTLRGEAGDAEKEIPFGSIAAVERVSDASARVVLRDGKRFELSAGRQSGRDNDGIFVDDPRWGRVLVSWGAVERVAFASGPASPPYDAFPAGRPLAGKVIGLDGVAHSGRLVFDLDESETWEFLNGNHLATHRAHPTFPADPQRQDPAGIQFNIPITLVAAVEPIDDESARVFLRDGRETVLEGETDCGEWNGGMLIYEKGAERPTYIPWKQVRRVEFDR